MVKQWRITLQRTIKTIMINESFSIRLREARQMMGLSMDKLVGGICVECISGIFAGLFWGEAVENKCETYKKSDE